MPYAHFDDRYDDHRKTKRAWRVSPAAVGLHAMAITYCNRHQTDGRVDAEWVEERLILSPLKQRECQQVIDTLVEAGMFERDGENYRVHDFLEWNRSRAQREALAEQGRRGGQARALAKGKKPDGDGSGPGSSHRYSHGSSESSGAGSSEGSSTPLHASPRQRQEEKNISASLRSAVLECFAYWQEKCAHPTAKLTADRRAKITARLREGYTVSDIRKAIDGAARGAFVNDAGRRFDDIELICRNGAKLESFVNRPESAQPIGQVVPMRRPSAGELIRKIEANESEAS